MLDRKNIDGNKAIKLYCLKIAQNQILTPVGWHLLANDRGARRCWCTWSKYI
jgi:hypothetical protein